MFDPFNGLRAGAFPRCATLSQAVKNKGKSCHVTWILFFYIQSQLLFVRWNLLSYRGVFAMSLTCLFFWGDWLQRVEPFLPLAGGVASAGILFGCAIASWLAPSEATDRLFHREVV